MHCTGEGKPNFPVPYPFSSLCKQGLEKYCTAWEEALALGAVTLSIQGFFNVCVNLGFSVFSEASKKAT